MHAALNLFLATRPAFLTITLLGCLIGLTVPSPSKQSIVINLLTFALVILVHAAANVINDYYDHLNGSDQNNHNRISPFTGGSRFIQDQLLKPTQIFHLGVALIILSTAIGLYVCKQTTWLLIPLGITGVIFGWAYSAPPLQLMSRGILGELSIAIAWSLVVIGFASIQTASFVYQAIPMGLAYGLMVSNILLVNQIPDIEADRTARKLTLATRTNGNELSNWYLGIIIAAYIFQLIGVHYFSASIGTLLTVLLLPIFVHCAKTIRMAKKQRDQTKKLIILNLVSIHLYALFLFIGMLLD